MTLLKGSSRAVIAENIRSLMASGLSQAQASKRAEAFAKQGESAPRSRVMITPKTGRGRSFVVVTKDFSGLGWAKRLQDEGESVTLAVKNPETDPQDKKQFETVGEGWLSVMDLDAAVSKLTSPSTYWVFAENNFPDVADRLRKKGQKVFGTGRLNDQMEHDRNHAVEVADEAGLKAPETHEFTTREEGLAFLDDHADTAYVLKPDEGQNYQTFVPELRDDEAANRETATYLEHLREEPGTYVLQERISGIEVNVEVWMFEGEPFFAFATLEAKRKNPGDMGEMSGCAGDLAWVVPVSSPIVAQTVKRMFPYFRQSKYTGFADVNVILTESGPRYLESCCRFGYNAHPTLFLGLASDPLGDVLADFMDGKTEGMERRFRPGFASSLTLFIDHPREGLPLHVDERWADQWYPFEGYEEDGVMLLAGYSPEVGIFVDHAGTPEQALQAVLHKVVDQEAVSFPDRYVRTDLAQTGYPNAILDRYATLQARGLA